VAKKRLANSKNIEKKHLPFSEHRIIFEDALKKLRDYYLFI
jgi:hypothetical protein